MVFECDKTVEKDDVMRKYKLCHAHLSPGEAAFKLGANLAVGCLWLCRMAAWSTSSGDA